MLDKVDNSFERRHSTASADEDEILALKLLHRISFPVGAPDPKRVAFSFF